MNAVSLPNGFMQFLVAAKRATYATRGDVASVSPVLLDSKQLEYRDAEFFYRDIYVGMLRFVGQEVVYVTERAVWSMSYSGGVLPRVEQSAIKLVYSFLRQALTAVPDHFPLRGPALFERDSTRYTFQCSGTVELFDGIEEIRQGSGCLFRLHVAGGRVA
jgi:hypothetical protein